MGSADSFAAAASAAAFSRGEAHRRHSFHFLNKAQLVAGELQHRDGVIAIGSAAGWHRSVVLVEELADWLARAVLPQISFE